MKTKEKNYHSRTNSNGFARLKARDPYSRMASVATLLNASLRTEETGCDCTGKSQSDSREPLVNVARICNNESAAFHRQKNFSRLSCLVSCGELFYTHVYTMDQFGHDFSFFLSQKNFS